MNSPRYATHQRLLKACCDAVEGTIVEFGAGDSSTPLINDWFPGRPKISIENKLEWLLHLAHYALWDHTFVFNPSPFRCVELAANAGVAFVDCDPANERHKIVEWLGAADTKIIVAHDTEPDCHPDYAWGDVFDNFKYRIDDNTQSPWTTAVSHTIDLSKLLE